MPSRPEPASSSSALPLGAPAAAFLNREITRNNFEILPIGLNHATDVEALAWHHRDPFDRLLVAQSRIERFPLVSADVIFDRYGVNRLW